MKLLVIGDIHIPGRADELPQKFLERSRSCDLIICTGDITDETVLEQLMESCAVHAVRGEEDYMDLPEQDLISVEDMKFGVIHGHQVEKTEDEGDVIDELVEMAELLGADVLVTGHTHMPFRTDKDGTVLLNPGSATGIDSDKKTCMYVEVEGTDMVSCEILTSE